MEFSHFNIFRGVGLCLLALVIASCGTRKEKPVLPAPPKPPLIKPQPPKPVVKETLPSTIKVGFVVPLSGPHANLGRSLQNAAQIAFFDMHNPSLEMIFADSEGTSEGAHRAVQNVLAQGAQMVIGPVFAEEVQAVKALVEARKTPLLAFTTDTSMADETVFVLGFSPQEQIQRVLAYAVQRGITRIATLTPSTAYGKLMDDVVSQLERQGLLTVVARENYTAEELGTQALATKMEMIQNAAPQALLIPEGGTALATLAPYLEAYGLDRSQTQLLGSGQWDSPELWQISNLQGAWFASPSPVLRQDFEKNYRTTFGNAAPPRIAPLAYDAVSLAAVLSDQKGFAARSLEASQGFGGMEGIFRFKDHVAERGLSILEVNGGQAIVRDPAPLKF